MNKTVYDKVIAELKELDKEIVEINGKRLNPSQCYHLSFNPFHLLFNTNCPDSLKEKILSIFKRYDLKQAYESKRRI
jgi:hypothetical protein